MTAVKQKPIKPRKWQPKKDPTHCIECNNPFNLTQRVFDVGVCLIHAGCVRSYKQTLADETKEQAAYEQRCNERERFADAAPDLLAALKDLLALPVALEALVFLRRGIGIDTKHAAWLRAEAAVFKAEGKVT